MLSSYCLEHIEQKSPFKVVTDWKKICLPCQTKKFIFKSFLTTWMPIFHDKYSQISLLLSGMINKNTVQPGC